MKHIFSKRIGYLFLFLCLAGCSQVYYRQPVLQPFVDAEYWMLREAMRYEIGETGQYIEVPRGFVTDFASTPSMLRPLFPKLGRYIIAAIVHDYLYWNQTCTRQQADKIFDLAMANSEVGTLKRNAMWAAVASFGGQAWDENKEKKAQGGVKVIPFYYIDVPERMTWDVYAQQLRRQGVNDGDMADLSATCAVVDKL